MKKICCIVFAFAICFSICGCQKENQEPTQPTQSTTIPVDDPAMVVPTEPDDEQSTVIPTPPVPEYPSELSPLTDDVANTIVLDKEVQLYAKIVGKIFTNVLVSELRYDEDVEQWGKTVYIITENNEKWCIGDQVIAYYTKVQQPYDQTQYARFYARDVYALPVCAKPIIYLYPQTPTQCAVSLTLNGELTCTYPDYGKNGWDNFTAYPDGTLIFPDGKEYYALYWEGVQDSEWDFSQGFCVPGEDTAQFLEWALAEQGLTRREANEFIVYWLPLMQDNPYNVISFQTAAYTDQAVLNVQPAPDTMLRVFMAYYPTENEVQIEPQSFETIFREGFTVVEWGGSQVKIP